MKQQYLVRGALFIAVLLVGCTEDISHHRALRDTIGRTLITQRATVLFAWGEHDATQEMRATLALTESDGLIPADYRFKMRQASIPAGQRVVVRHVEKRVSDGAIFYDALGEIFVPARRAFIPFRYAWGTDGKFRRAPWEAESTPPMRKML